MKELTATELVKWKRIITDVLAKFIEICKEHNLTYFCCGGTAIGAIRHSGMIPWDDDIDVFMPRPDYDAFIKLASSIDLGEYELVTPYNKEGYPLYFAKLCNKETTLQEICDIPCVYGLYVDIFPIDGAPDEIVEGQQQEARFRKLKYAMGTIAAHFTFREYISLLRRRNEWGRFVWKTIGFFFREPYRKWILTKMEKICRQYDYNASKTVAVYCGSYGAKEVFPKKWLDGIVEFQFEGLTVDLPKGYDEYLRQYYGNYMQLPPVEKRVSHHFKAYYNLTERESDEQVFMKARN